MVKSPPAASSTIKKLDLVSLNIRTSSLCAARGTRRVDSTQLSSTASMKDKRGYPPPAKTTRRSDRSPSPTRRVGSRPLL